MDVIEKCKTILSVLFSNKDSMPPIRVFINGQKKEGKIYLPLDVSVVGLEKLPENFGFYSEVRENGTIIHF